VGMCTRTDILKAAGKLLSADQPEAGWLSRLRSTQGPESRPEI
jgi:hypothetical protein